MVIAFNFQNFVVVLIDNCSDRSCPRRGHLIDWDNYEILENEIDYHTRKFIESFYLNSLSNVLNDKKSVCFAKIYQNFFS